MMKALATNCKDFLASFEGSRRWLATLGCGAVNALLVHFKDITSDNYVTVTLGTVAVYIGAAAYSEKQKAKEQDDV